MAEESDVILSGTKLPLYGINQQELPVDNILGHPYKSDTVFVLSYDVLYEINATSCVAIGARLPSISRAESVNGGLCQPVKGSNYSSIVDPYFDYVTDMDILKIEDTYFILLTVYYDSCVRSYEILPNSSYHRTTYLGQCGYKGITADGYRNETRLVHPTNTIVVTGLNAFSSLRTITFYYWEHMTTCEVSTDLCTIDLLPYDLEIDSLTSCFSAKFDILALNSYQKTLILQFGDSLSVDVHNVPQQACTFMGNYLFIIDWNGTLQAVNISEGLNENITFIDVKVLEGNHSLDQHPDDGKFLSSLDGESIFMFSYTQNSSYKLLELVCDGRPNHENGHLQISHRSLSGDCGTKHFLYFYANEMVFCGYVCAKTDRCNSFSYDEASHSCKLHDCYFKSTGKGNHQTRCYIMS